jgi:hypothetical protein
MLTLQAWKQNNLDLAWHMYKEISSTAFDHDPRGAEELTETLSQIGRDQLSDVGATAAIPWLESAADLIANQPSGLLSDNAPNLRLATLDTLACAHLALSSPEGRARADEIAALLETEIGEKAEVVELRLKILSAAATESKDRGDDAVMDALAYRGALARLARCMRLNEASFMDFLRHVCRLRDVDVAQAVGALDDFLEAKLFDCEQVEFIEQAVVTRVSITAMAGNSSSEAAQELTAFLDRVGRNLKSPFSEEASTGSIVLVWKIVEREIAQNNYRIATELCRVARHRVFEHGCELNKAVIARKMMLCALADNDFNAARGAFFLMSEPSQENPLSRYLLYKVALRSGDDALGKISNAESLAKKQRPSASTLFPGALRMMELFFTAASWRHRKLDTGSKRSSRSRNWSLTNITRPLTGSISRLS